MGVKSEIIRNEDETTYPVLMAKLANKEMVVLFTSAKRGTVVACNDSTQIGYYSNTWIHEFKPYNGKVVLKNG